MKKITIIALSVFLIYACNSSATNGETSVEVLAEQDESKLAELETSEWIQKGEEISPDGAIDIETFKTEIAKQTKLNTKLKTNIKSCCQKKGCWMKVDLGNGEEMRVTFKDYGFFVPLDAAGSEVIIEGNAYYDTTSVEMLRHYAEDAGDSPEEISKITEPKLELAFEATGVLLK